MHPHEYTMVITDVRHENKDEGDMSIIGVITSILGLGVLIFSMMHDFNLDVHKGAMLQPMLFGSIGTLLLICGLIILLFSVFRQKPYRGNE